MSHAWVTLSVAFLFACGRAANVPSTLSGAPNVQTVPTSTSASSALKAPGEATFGDRTLCLVSNEEFTVSSASPKVEYRGKIYYFCCAGCDTKFKENPEKYLKGSSG